METEQYRRQYFVQEEGWVWFWYGVWDKVRCVAWEIITESSKSSSHCNCQQVASLKCEGECEPL